MDLLVRISNFVYWTKHSQLTRGSSLCSYALLQLCSFTLPLLTHCDTADSWCNCLLLVLTTLLFPWSKVGFGILLSGTPVKDVKEVEGLFSTQLPYTDLLSLSVTGKGDLGNTSSQLNLQASVPLVYCHQTESARFIGRTSTMRDYM